MKLLVIFGLILSSIIGAGTIGSVMMDNGDLWMMGGDHGMMGDNGMPEECQMMDDYEQDHCDGDMDENCDDHSYDECEAISDDCEVELYDHCEHVEHHHQ